MPDPRRSEPDPWRRTQARDYGVGCFARHCDWHRGIALTIKNRAEARWQTKPGGIHMAKFAVTQSPAPYCARRRKILQGALAAVMAIPLAGLQTRHVAAAERAVVIPPPVLDGPAAKGGLQTAVLAGGCFWG